MPTKPKPLGSSSASTRSPQHGLGQGGAEGLRSFRRHQDAVKPSTNQKHTTFTPLCWHWGNNNHVLNFTKPFYPPCHLILEAILEAGWWDHITHLYFYFTVRKLRLCALKEQPQLFSGAARAQLTPGRTLFILPHLGRGDLKREICWFALVPIVFGSSHRFGA